MDDEVLLRVPFENLVGLSFVMKHPLFVLMITGGDLQHILTHKLCTNEIISDEIILIK